jgi:hypothetical protein
MRRGSGAAAARGLLHILTNSRRAPRRTARKGARCATHRTCSARLPVADHDHGGGHDALAEGEFASDAAARAPRSELARREQQGALACWGRGKQGRVFSWKQGRRYGEELLRLLFWGGVLSIGGRGPAM